MLDDDPSTVSDVWACAVLVHFLVSTSCFLFPSDRSIPNEVLGSMMLSQGKLPEHFWLKWEERGQYSDESGQWVADPETLPIFAGVCPSRVNEEQKIPFELIIRKMVAYEPRERAIVAELVRQMVTG